MKLEISQIANIGGESNYRFTRLLVNYVTQQVRSLTIKKIAQKYGARTWLVWDHSNKNSLYYPHQHILAHRSYQSPTSPDMKRDLNGSFQNRTRSNCAQCFQQHNLTADGSIYLDMARNAVMNKKRSMNQYQKFYFTSRSKQAIPYFPNEVEMGAFLSTNLHSGIGYTRVKDFTCVHRSHSSINSACFSSLL